MPVTYPDNPRREARVRELATTIQMDMFEASHDFLEFQKLCETANTRITQAYQEAKLTPPTAKLLEVITLAGVADESRSTVVTVSKVIIDVAGAAFALSSLVAGATRMLVDVGVISGERAAEVLVQLPVKVMGRTVAVTVGDVLGATLVGVASGIAIAGIDIGIDAIEGAIAKSHLQDAIHGLHPIRLATRVSLSQARELVRSMRSVVDAVEAITGDADDPAATPLTEKQLERIIARSVRPALDAVKKITPESVAAELAEADRTNHSWTDEDV